MAMRSVMDVVRSRALSAREQEGVKFSVFDLLDESVFRRQQSFQDRVVEPIVEVDEEPIVEVDEEPIVEVDEEPIVEVDEEPTMEVDEEPAMEVDEELTMEVDEEQGVEVDGEPDVEPLMEEDVPLVREPIVQQYEDRDVPDLDRIDVDAACFMMDTSELPQLIGQIGRPAKRKIKVRDSNYFNGWLHVISDPVVVKIDAGINREEREDTKRRLCTELRRGHGLVLTLNEDEEILSKNSANIPIQAMVEALLACPQCECRVQFYGMKWTLPNAEQAIDGVVQVYRNRFESQALDRLNQFDIGVGLKREELTILGFGVDQSGPHRRFRKGLVHEMLNWRGMGSIEFAIDGIEQIAKVKIYQVLVHEVLSFISREHMDDIPQTMRTIHTRVEQMEGLLDKWDSYDQEEIEERLTDLRVEVSVTGVNTVQEARELCINLDVLNLRGIQRLLGGPFDIQTISIQELLASVHEKMGELTRAIRGRNHLRPNHIVRTALTEARQAFGWSGKYMESQLQEARQWKHAIAEQERQRQDPRFLYDGYQMDDDRDQPLIVDFLENALWMNHSRSRMLEEEPIMLKKTHGGGFWKKQGIYEDRVGAARHFIRLYRENWRDHVKAV